MSHDIGAHSHLVMDVFGTTGSRLCGAVWQPQPPPRDMKNMLVKSCGRVSRNRRNQWYRNIFDGFSSLPWLDSATKMGNKHTYPIQSNELGISNVVGSVRFVEKTSQNTVSG